MPEITTVCTPETFGPLVSSHIEEFYKVVQEKIHKGVRIKTSDMTLTIQGIMLTADGLDKFQTSSEQSRSGTEEQVSEIPEVRATTTSKRVAKSDTTGKQDELSTDKGTTTSSETQRDDSTEAGTQATITEDNDQSDTSQIHGTADDITTTSTV